MTYPMTRDREMPPIQERPFRDLGTGFALIILGTLGAIGGTWLAWTCKFLTSWIATAF